MTYPIGTLLRDDEGNFYEVESEKRVCQVSGYHRGVRWYIRPSMRPVEYPPNVTESPTVPDWATSVPLGGMVLK